MLRYILYSIGCTYQNINSTLSKALLHFAVMQNEEIEQKYLEKGHTQMEVEPVHGRVERHQKNFSACVRAQYVDRQHPFLIESSACTMISKKILTTSATWVQFPPPPPPRKISGRSYSD